MADYVKMIRKKIGHDPLIMCGAGIIIYTDDLILLQKRRDVGLWGHFGGAVELFESVADAAKRELFEESGLIANKLELLGDFSDPDYTYPNGDRVSIVGFVYICDDFSGEIITVTDETLDCRWFSTDDLPELFPPDVDAITAFIKKHNEQKISWPTHIVAAGAIVENDRGEILLVKTPARGWEFPGGQVENGESLIEAALREVLEESSIKIEVKEIIGIYSNVQELLHYDGKTIVPTKVMTDFKCKYISGEFKISDETIDGIWIKKENVLDFITHDAYIFRFKVYLQNNSGITYASYKSRPFRILSCDIL